MFGIYQDSDHPFAALVEAAEKVTRRLISTATIAPVHGNLAGLGDEFAGDGYFPLLGKFNLGKKISVPPAHCPEPNRVRDQVSQPSVHYSLWITRHVDS